MLHTIRIIPKETAGLYDVEMDGTTLENVEDVQIDLHAQTILRVKIGFFAKNVDVEVRLADVEVIENAKGK